MLHTIHSYWDDFLSLFYPRTCLTCDRLLPKSLDHLCPHCLANIPRTQNHIIPVPSFNQKFEGLVSIRSVFVYSHFVKHGIMQKVLHELKYNHNPEIGVYFGKRYGNELKNHLTDKFDYIIPVPIHPKKLKIRGYNQAEEIGMGMSETLHIPILNEVLIRRVQKASQTKRSKVARIKSMESTFQCNLGMDLDSKHILLVDDVLTTGATLIACAEALKEKYKCQISILTLAGLQ